MEAVDNNSEVIDWFLDCSKAVIWISILYFVFTLDIWQAFAVGLTGVYMVAGFAFTFIICKKMFSTNFSDLSRRIYSRTILDR